MTSDQQAFPARIDAIRATAAFVGGFCARQGIGGDAALRVTLIVEELFTNIVQHGYGPGAAGTVHLLLSRDGDAVRIVCVDAAPPFDPRPVLGRAPPDLGEAPASRRVGGLGVWLVGSLAAVESYERVDGTNRLTMRVECGPRDEIGGGR